MFTTRVFKKKLKRPCMHSTVRYFLKKVFSVPPNEFTFGGANVILNLLKLEDVSFDVDMFPEVRLFYSA